MHCLVKYIEDNILHIVPTKSLCEIEKNKLYWAPYKRMGYYEAVPICYDNDRQSLEAKKKKLHEITDFDSVETKIRTNNYEKDISNYGNQKGLKKSGNNKYNTGDQKNNCDIEEDIHWKISKELCNNEKNPGNIEEVIYQKKSKKVDSNESTNSIKDICQNKSKNLDENEKDISNIKEGIRQKKTKKLKYEEHINIKENNHQKKSVKLKVNDKYIVNIEDDVYYKLGKNKKDTSNIDEDIDQKNLKKMDDNEKTTSNIEGEIPKIRSNKELSKYQNTPTKMDSKLDDSEKNINNIGEDIPQKKSNKESRKNKKKSKSYSEQDDTEKNINYNKEDTLQRKSNKESRKKEKLKKSYSKQDDNEKNNNTKEDIHQDATKKPTHKQHCCYFCKKILYQLPKHWFNVHYKQNEVKQILSMHPNNPDRVEKMDELRKKGDFEYNRQACDEKKIVIRRSNMINVKYIPCPSCLGYFSKDNLRHHRKRCSPHKGDRLLQGNSRKLTKFMHERASLTLRNHIASSMYQYEVSNHFLFDEIIILYGNYLCIKYTDSHLKNYIRAQLRLLGRFMMQAKVNDPSIKCCKDLMHPTHIDTIRKSIDTVAGLNSNTGIYKHPTNARILSTELKKILEVVQFECDKKEDDHLMKLTKALSRLYKLELAPYINRICKLSENKYKRIRRDTTLPENSEIEKYLRYLLEKVSFHCANLERKYSFGDWNKLCQYILVALIVFNRKRPGETQRIELEDFYKKEIVSEKDMEILNEEEKLQADKYVRVAFRGKLGNSTALLIDKHKILPGIEILIKHRPKAGVHPDNRFLFACPSSKDKNKIYDAYRCHRQLLEESGLKSVSLTFTRLRKQFATQVAKGAPSHEEEMRISNYMSHDYNIHKRIYDQSTSLVDIARVSKHLEESAKDKPGYRKGLNEKNVLNNAKYKERKQKLVGLDERKNSSISDDVSLLGSTSEDNLGQVKLKQYLGKSKHRKLADECERDEERGDRSDDEYLSSSGSEKENPDSTKVDRCLGNFKQRKLSIPKEKRIERNFEKSKYERAKRKFTEISKENKRKCDENDEYVPYSASEEEELDQVVQRCLGKFKSRKLWTSEEKKVTRNYFQNELTKKSFIIKTKIKEFKEKYSELMINRSVAMINQWLEGEIARIELKEDGVPEKRPRYSTPELELLEKSTERHSLEGSEPSIEELQDLIDTNDILKRRTAHSLLQKFRNLSKPKDGEGLDATLLTGNIP